jgi:NADP-dependent 3-hydroxy acid dehydrogenase YdfG
MGGKAAGGRPLRGRSVVVTGASRGIGLECARALHGAGARVVMLARSATKIRQAAAELGKDAHAVACDVGDRDSVQSAIGEIRALIGGAPDILVNNAGQFLVAAARDTPLDEFERILRVNLVSQFAFVSAFLPDLGARGAGHIVTIGSIADRVAYAENSAYAASKFGARGLHQVLREELRGTGVRSTLVSPGPVDTPLWDDVQPEKRKGHTPRSRMLAAVAVADAVRYVVTRPADVNVDELRLSRA